MSKHWLTVRVPDTHVKQARRCICDLTAMMELSEGNPTPEDQLLLVTEMEVVGSSPNDLVDRTVEVAEELAKSFSDNWTVVPRNLRREFVRIFIKGIPVESVTVFRKEFWTDG